MHVIPIGADTETKRGKPITFQFFSKELDHARIIFLKDSKRATEHFFGYLDSLPHTRDRHYVLFGHNLSFDMVSFFYDRHNVLRDETITGEWYGWKVKIVYAAVRFAEFSRAGRHVLLIDTGAFFAGRSLASLGEIFSPDLPKLKMPKGLGERSFTKRDSAFCAYALRDAEIAYYIGQNLIAQHRKWDISICVSAPHFASKVFRKHFMQKTIPLPPRKIVYASMNAYHGGKNNLSVEKGMYKNVYSIDIKSAYPAAMAVFPSFTNPALYKGLSGNRNPKRLPPFGIYRVSGTAKNCKWPILYTHNFKALQGEFTRVWVTGFEVNEALRSNEIKLSETYGYYYDAEQDKEPSSFKAYAETFFGLKEGAENPVEKEFNKLLLNSLYGKFIQTRATSSITDLVYDVDESKIISDSAVIAGGLFNPFIAALITGHTRARIHQLEHEYQALHTSTDGVQTQIKPGELKGGLGGISLEAKGDSLIFRNKLYIIYAPLSSADRKNIAAGNAEGKRIILSKIYPRKKIVKYAKHGFHGKLETLESMWKSDTREYEYTKVNKLRESLNRGLQVNDFVPKTAKLNF